MQKLGPFQCLNLRQVLALVVCVLGLVPTAFGQAGGAGVLGPEQPPFLQTSKGLHQVRVLNDGLSAFEVRLEMIEKAQSQIDLMVYLFGRDESSRLTLHTLMRKALAGVHVRVLLDYFTGSGHPDIDDEVAVAIQQELRRRGPMKGSFEIRYYNRGTLWGSLGRVNHRNHAKMMVTDRSEVLVGGRNVGDDYFSMIQGGFDYIDREIWARGPVGLQARSAFDAYWNNREWVSSVQPPKVALSEAVQKLVSLETDEKENQLRQNVQASSVKGSANLRLVNNVTLAIDKPAHEKNDRIVTPTLNRLMENTNQYLLIENYSLPMSDAKLKVLKSVSSRGVPLLILTNSYESHDSPGVSAYSQTVEGQLLKLPRTWIFAYRGDALPNALKFDDRKPPKVYSTHTKSLVSMSSSAWTAAVGSYNFDVRSEQTNNEAMLIIDDVHVASDVAVDIGYRMQFSHPLAVSENGQMYYSDSQQFEHREFSDFKKVMQSIGLGKLLRSLY